MSLQRANPRWYGQKYIVRFSENERYWGEGKLEGVAVIAKEAGH